MNTFYTLKFQMRSTVTLGFSMAEVLVAVALTSLSAAGIITGLSYAKKSQKDVSYRETQAKFIQSFENVLGETVRDFVADDCSGHRYGYAAGGGGSTNPVAAAFASFKLAGDNTLGGQLTYTTAPTGYAPEFAAAAARCASPKPTNDSSGKGSVGAGEYAHFCMNFTMNHTGVMTKTNSFWNMDQAFVEVMILPIQADTDAPVMCSGVVGEGQAIKVIYSIYSSYNPRMSVGSTEMKGLRTNGAMYIAGMTPAPGGAISGANCLFAVSGTYTGSLGTYGSKFPNTLSGNPPASGERFDRAGGVYVGVNATPYRYNVSPKLIDGAFLNTFDSFVIPPDLHVTIRRNDGTTTIFDADSGPEGIIGQSTYYWNKYPTAYYNALKKNPYLPSWMKAKLAKGRLAAITPVALHPGHFRNLATDAAWVQVTAVAGGACDTGGGSGSGSGSGTGGGSGSGSGSGSGTGGGSGSGSGSGSGTGGGSGGGTGGPNSCDCIYNTSFFSGDLASCESACMTNGFETGLLANGGLYCECKSTATSLSICPQNLKLVGAPWADLCSVN